MQAACSTDQGPQTLVLVAAEMAMWEWIQRRERKRKRKRKKEERKEERKKEEEEEEEEEERRRTSLGSKTVMVPLERSNSAFSSPFSTTRAGKFNLQELNH